MIKVEVMAMRNICILDLDGTLVNTLDSILISANKTMEELLLPEITHVQCRAFIGHGARYLVKQCILSSCDNCEETLVDRGVEIYMRIFAENCMYQVAPYEGIPEVLESLKAQGTRFAILSNKPHGQTVEIAENYFGKGYFEFIQGQCDGIPRKPDPESLNYIMRQLDVDKDQCIYVGDSEVDMITGEGAGIATIGVSWGFRDRAVLESVKPWAIIDKPEQLLTSINKMNEE